MEVKAVFLVDELTSFRHFNMLNNLIGLDNIRESNFQVGNIISLDNSPVTHVALNFTTVIGHVLDEAKQWPKRQRLSSATPEMLLGVRLMLYHM